ncbi:MAG: substrate-binding domain-containing protein [Bacteroidales bacterium]
MELKKKPIRIKDIAELAGVSAGTVDRVLHSRGEVSQESKEKVEKVLRELNYKPNVFASALASKRKEHKFVYMMPIHSPGDYWDSIESGIRKAEREYLSVNVVLQPVLFDQYDVDSFKRAVQVALNHEPQAILLAPVFRDETVQFLKELNFRSIPYVFFDSRIEGENSFAYYGQDSFKSGYLACKLMMTSVPKGSEIVLFHSKRHGIFSNQTAVRKEGFLKCAQEMELEYQIHTIEIPINDEIEAKYQIESLLRNYPNTRGAVIFNSRSYLIGENLDMLDGKKLQVIGFDALEKNVECLKRGTIQYLIGQRPEIQGYKSVKVLCDGIIFKQPVTAVNYMPLDILTADNIDYYCDFEYM